MRMQRAPQQQHQQQGQQVGMRGVTQEKPRPLDLSPAAKSSSRAALHPLSSSSSSNRKSTVDTLLRPQRHLLRLLVGAGTLLLLHSQVRPQEVAMHGRVQGTAGRVTFIWSPSGCRSFTPYPSSRDSSGCSRGTTCCVREWAQVPGHCPTVGRICNRWRCAAGHRGQLVHARHNVSSWAASATGVFL
jgi:hypothetical protein